MSAIEQYAEAGKLWAGGKDFTNPIVIGDKTWNLNEKQLAFLNSRDRFCLAYGGMGSGKTLAFIIKLILLSVLFPDNRILLGRKTLKAVESTTLPDFFDICPQEWYEYKPGPAIIKFFNGSEIILKGLDVLQGGEDKEIKKSVQEIKSLNLGAFFIDQLEEVEEEVVQALKFRLRRNVGFQQGNMATNPENFWAHDYFIVNPRPGTKAIQFSMLDNKQYLSEEFIQSALNEDPDYVQRMVYGVWDPALFMKGGVFSEQYAKQQAFYVKPPVREFEGIKIWAEPKHGLTYQVGVDASDGSVDPCSIEVICRETGEQVASYSGQFVPVDDQAKKLMFLLPMYSPTEKAMLIPEVFPSASGAVLLEKIKFFWTRIHERESYNYRERKRTKKLGFQTNFATKRMLIDNFSQLLKTNSIKIREKEALSEMASFVWSNEAKKAGAGAKNNFHDDRVMALMLAYHGVKIITPREGYLTNLLAKEQTKTKIQFQYK